MIKVTGACYGSLCHGMEENMLKARKANRVIRIPDEKKDAYAALGYKITDMNDKVVAEPHNAEKEAETLKTKRFYVKQPRHVFRTHRSCPVVFYYRRMFQSSSCSPRMDLL